MTTHESCLLTTKDFVVLQSLVNGHRFGTERIQEKLRDKLAAAAVLAPGDIPPQVITLDSRVCFSRDGRPLETRVISISDEIYPLGAALSVATPLGLDLLGRRSGDAFAVQGYHGEETQAEIFAVIYQPEAAEQRLRCA